MDNRKDPTQKTTDINRCACHVDTAEDCLRDKTSDKETVTKLQTKRDFRDMLEHCHPTLEHLCNPRSQYEFNSCINVKNGCLSQNSTSFELLRTLQIPCFQLLHVNDLMDVVIENLFHWVLLLIPHKNYCRVLRNLLGQVNNVRYCNRWCYDDYINLNNCNVVDTLIIRVYYNVRHFRNSKYTYICTHYFKVCLINKAYTRAQQILGARAP